jgi:hypothetical protein
MFEKVNYTTAEMKLNIKIPIKQHIANKELRAIFNNTCEMNG